MGQGDPEAAAVLSQRKGEAWPQAEGGEAGPAPSPPSTWSFGIFGFRSRSDQGSKLGGSISSLWTNLFAS